MFDLPRRTLIQLGLASTASLLLPRRADAQSSRPLLPVDDPDTAGRQRQLEKARDLYAYSYDSSSFRGLATVAVVPRREQPSALWQAKVVSTLNTIKRNTADQDAAPQEKAEGFAVRLRDAGPQGSELMFSSVIDTKLNRTFGDEPRSYGDYSRLFRSMTVPPTATEHHRDTAFARARLAGLNPAWLRQVRPDEGLPDDFAVNASHMGEGDSLEAALKEGRLFLCSYRELLSMDPGSFPCPDFPDIDYSDDPAGWDAAYAARQKRYAEGRMRKHVVAPLALFSVPRGGGTLSPVAIQLNPNGTHGQRWPVFTPRDGVSWQAAKVCVSAADGNAHQFISHLGHTHLVQEAFALAMHNCLSARHPLHRLLSPHFEGTLSINFGANAQLVAPAGPVDNLLMGTINSMVGVCAEAVKTYDFTASLLPNRLAAQGLTDIDLLPDFPYRDDALLLWGAIERWVSAYIHAAYPSNREVRRDTELAAFIVQVGSYDARDASGRRVGGGIGGVPAVQTREALTTLAAGIIFNGSVQHSAVNFPQLDQSSYVPALPAALRGRLPDGGTFTEADLLAMLPPLDHARQQLGVSVLLGSVHHTPLGQYSGLGPWIKREVTAFQDDLAQIEATITERNLTRAPYPYLLPSRIEQSVNI